VHVSLLEGQGSGAQRAAFFTYSVHPVNPTFDPFFLCAENRDLFYAKHAKHI
jgi:hypothetical protein